MAGTVVVNQPGVYLVDEDGNVSSLDDGATIGSAEGIIIMGKDGTVARMLAVDSSGNLAALPLPTGAATETTLTGLAKNTKLEAVRALLETIDADTSNLDVTLSTVATTANQTNKTQFSRITDGTNDAEVDGVRLKVVDESYSVARDDIVGADNHRTGLTGAPNYGLAVDLDNAGGFYKHSASSVGIELYAVSANLIKTQNGAEWEAIGGVILRIDGTDADVAWLEFLSLHAEDTSSNVTTKAREAFPVPIDLTVTAGELSKIAAGFIETNIAAINTGITLPDIEGTGRTPAVGDLVSRVTKISGSGTATFHASLWYRGVL